MYGDTVKSNKEWIDDMWNKLDEKLSRTAVKSRNKIPYSTVNGVHDNMAKTDITWWTNGFWPGLMWLMYVGTKKECYKETAEKAEEMLDEAFKDYDRLHHDVGFMWNISSGVNYRLFGGKASRLRTAYAADILASRYNAQGKFIRAWNGDNVGWVIIDSMMNIPLLYRASQMCGDDRFKYIAMQHADHTMTSHIRPDGSVNHIVDLDPVTGETVQCIGGQGYGEGSSWSRGQAWAIYGYVLSYIHTGKQEYLDTAKRTAHYFISNVCDDWLPKVDFRSPEEPVYYDSTAGACAACGLIEIARNVPEYEQKMYINAAVNILKAMEKKFCDWTEDEDGILLMGTERYTPTWKPAEQTRHISIIYGDYFFAEAIYKLKGFDVLFW